MTSHGARLLGAALLLLLTGCHPDAAPTAAGSSVTSPASPSQASSYPVPSQPLPPTGGPAVAAAIGAAQCTDPAGDTKGIDLTSLKVTGDGHRLTITFKLTKALPANGYLNLGANSGPDLLTTFWLKPDKSGKATQSYWIFGQNPVYLNDARIDGSTITLNFPAESLEGFSANWAWTAHVGTALSSGRRIESDGCPDTSRQLGMNKFPG